MTQNKKQPWWIRTANEKASAVILAGRPGFEAMAERIKVRQTKAIDDLIEEHVSELDLEDWVALEGNEFSE